jgi:hypothetical protein
MPKHEQFKARFGNIPPTPEEIITAYKDFVENIRKIYPETHIICALGSMDATKKGSPWPGYVREAVNHMDDDKLYIHLFPFIQKSGHPKVENHKEMAQSLIQLINHNIEW